MNYRQHAWLWAITCAQLLFCAGPAVSAGEAEDRSRNDPAPKISVIRDLCVSEVFLRFSPDGRELVRIPQFGPVLLSNTTNFQKARSFRIEMRMIAYSPDGTLMATAEGNDGARVWAAQAEGKRIAHPGTVEVNLIETPLQVLQAPGKNPRERVFRTEFSPDGKRLITTHANGHVKVWNTSSWALEEELTLSSNEVRAADFAPDSQSLVFGDVQGVLHHWSFADKTNRLSGLTREPVEPVLSVMFAPDGKTLVTCHQGLSNSLVRIWNTSTWAAQIEDRLACAAFSKDGKVLALGGERIKLIDPGSGRLIQTIELPPMRIREFGPAFKKLPRADQPIPTQIRALAFSPDARTLAVGCLGPLRLVQLSSP